MADIFVSYAREDEARIAALVRWLEAQGLSVFWDRHIPPGTSWREHIGQALADARCVIVAWSRHSIASSFVAEEADDARARGILVPVMIDAVMPPLGFRSLQAADLVDMGGNTEPAEFGSLMAAIRAAIGGAVRPSAQPVQRSQPPPRRGTRNKLVGMLAVGAVGMAAAFLAWWQYSDGGAVANVSQSVEATRESTPTRVTGARMVAGSDSVAVLETLRGESGSLQVVVQVTHRGDTEIGITGANAFALVRRDGSLEEAQESSPIHFTLQPDSTQKFGLKFEHSDGVALRVTLPGQPAQVLRLPVAP